MPRLAVLFVLSAASSPCPDLNLIHYICKTAPKIRLEMKTTGFCIAQNPAEQIFKNIRSLLDDSHFQTTFDHLSII